MTTYTAYFRTDAGQAEEDIEADTPQQALAKAQELLAKVPSDLWIEAFDDLGQVNEIEIESPRQDEQPVWWHDADMHLRLAAQDLLDALTDLVERDRAEAADSGFTDDEMTWLEDARRAIAKAKGGAP
jgi:hypothetical protein